MKWEYVTIDLSVFDNVDKRLNTMGSSDWELVSVDAGVAYFKRPIEDEYRRSKTYKAIEHPGNMLTLREVG